MWDNRATMHRARRYDRPRCATCAAPRSPATARRWSRPPVKNFCTAEIVRVPLQKDAVIPENEIGTAIQFARCDKGSTRLVGLRSKAAYEVCLVYELGETRLPGRLRQTATPCRFVYEGLVSRYRLPHRSCCRKSSCCGAQDPSKAILPVHRSQLLSYLRFGGFKLGYLFNFMFCNMPRYRYRSDGLQRFVIPPAISAISLRPLLRGCLCVGR